MSVSEIKIGDAYLSSELFCGQILVVENMEPVEERFGKENRVVHIARYATDKNNKWCLVSHDKIWADPWLGPKVPDDLVKELYE